MTLTPNDGDAGATFQVRKGKTGNFAMLDNALLRNGRLSFKARGILCHLLSHAEGWTIRMSELSNGAVDGETAIRSGVDELVKAGYVSRNRVRTATGQMAGWRYLVSEIPEFTDTRFPSIGNSEIGESSPKKTKLKEDHPEEKAISLREMAGASSASPFPEPSEEDGLAQYLNGHAEAQAPLLVSEDDAPAGKTFPWKQVMSAMKRIVPEVNMPPKGDRRDQTMKTFWRQRGRTVGCFELLAQKMQASDYLMARNGHEGQSGRPFSWSWVFSKNRQGDLRADAIMEGGYSTEAMAFVFEKRNKEARAAMTKVMFPGPSGTEPSLVDMTETWEGKPRYRICGEHQNGLPEVLDDKVA